MIRSTALLTLALACPAGAFELALPVDCILGESCYIQQFADHDPGAAATDFTCGSLSYDGHDGTDFAVPTRSAMTEGVAVLAAAPGTVKGTRDGLPDFAPAIVGKECGNGLVILHADGWETQYCHLRQGSLRVTPGDRVETGNVLGLIGQSGLAEFPHLHLSVRRNGQTVDPFSMGARSCGASPQDLWRTDLPYQPGGLLDIGITSAVPDYETIKAGLAAPALSSTAPALVVWAYIFGTRAGDALLVTLTGPGGIVFTDRVQLDKTQALAFRAVGRKLKTPGWPVGTYSAEARLMRGATEVDRTALRIEITP